MEKWVQREHPIKKTVSGRTQSSCRIGGGHKKPSGLRIMSLECRQLYSDSNCTVTALGQEDGQAVCSRTEWPRPLSTVRVVSFLRLPH